MNDITVQEISRTILYNYYTNVNNIYKQPEKNVLADLEKIMQIFGMTNEKDMFSVI